MSGLAPHCALPIRIGISRCLLGEAVRYDGGHKRDRFVTEVLSRHVEWVPICPEVEAGLGTPREAMRLVGDASKPQLITISTNRNMTRRLSSYTGQKLDTLKQVNLAGYIFKKDSPSCGIERVNLFNDHGRASRAAVGLFARAFKERYPLVPIEDEGRLSDPTLRDNFIERVFCYHRWLLLTQSTPTRQSVVVFHTVHKYLLLAHSPGLYQSLGRLVAQAHRYTPRELVQRYGALFMNALAINATRRKHVNVLQHLVGHLRERLTPKERTELTDVIEEYHQGLVPLIVPITLIKHYVMMYDVEYIQHQLYLNPHPKELMLRNYV